MKRINTIIGWFIIIMGIIHLSVTPMVAKEASGMEHDLFLVFLFMFITTGVAFIFIGYIILYLQRQSEKTGLSNNRVLMVSALMVVSLGIFGVFMMPATYRIDTEPPY